MRRLSRAAALIGVLAAIGSAAPAAFAVGGPVILGGDDLTDHGSVSGGVSQTGWLYIEKAIGNIKPQVGRTNNNSIAAFGTSASSATSADAGAAIGNAASKNGMTVSYFDGATAINNGFASIANGSYRPAIVWIAGDGANNDIDACTGTGTEGAAITANASVINDFVNEGGGLMAHSLCYQWLTALIPGLTTVPNGTSGNNDLYLTADGTSAFPGVTNADVGAGPWHNYFQGDFGGLKVLARSNTVDDNTAADAAVVIGGGQVSLTQKPVDLQLTMSGPSSGTVGGDVTYTITVTNNGPSPATGVTVTDPLPSNATYRSASTSQGSCSGTTTVTCAIGNLAVGATATITIVVRPTGSGTLTNNATVAGDQPDPVASNDADAGATTVPVASADPPGAQADRRAPRIRVAGVSAASCHSSAFTARFTITDASRLRRADVYVDSKRVKRTTSKRFSVRVSVAGLAAGKHRVRVVARDRSNNRSSQTRNFRRCAIAAAAPRFTG